MKETTVSTSALTLRDIFRRLELLTLFKDFRKSMKMHKIIAAI